MSTKKNSKKRLAANSVRAHHLVAAVTHKDKREIVTYCISRNLTISQFLAEITLREARFKGKRVTKQVTIELPYEEYAKIDYVATARGITPEECIYELLRPALGKQRAWNAPREQTFRYYLSPEEHKQVIQYMAKHNLSSRHFVGLLAKRYIAYLKSGGRERRNYPWNRKG